MSNPDYSSVSNQPKHTASGGAKAKGGTSAKGSLRMANQTKPGLPGPATSEKRSIPKFGRVVKHYAQSKGIVA